MEAKWSDYPPWDPTVLEEAFFDLFSNSEESIRHDLPDSLLLIDSLFPLDTVTAHNEGIDDNCYSTNTEDANFSMLCPERENSSQTKMLQALQHLVFLESNILGTRPIPPHC